MNERYSEIDEVIAFIHENIYDPLPLSRLAAYAAYSPYHFTRIFKEKTGIPPLYYVSSLRLQKAKDLLLRTNLSVRDIGLTVGQQSLGTFTTRFTERVGVTPSDFRNKAQQADEHLRSLQKINDWREPQLITSPYSTVEGTIHAVRPFQGIILIGLFAKPIPEGLPIHGTLLSSVGQFCFTGVKPGTYYLMATTLSWGMNAMDILIPQATLRTRTKEPIVVGPAAGVHYREVMLHEPRPDDPPILVSLPVLMNTFLTKVLQTSR